METIVGTRTKLLLVSKSHGIVRVPLAQSFDYTPKFTERTIFEFDNTEAALVVTSFDGVDVRFDYFDTDSALVDAVLNDNDPSSAVNTYDPSQLKELNIILNVKGEDGLIFQSILAKGTRVKGVTTTEPVREESRITIDGAARNALRIKGAAMLYTRAIAAVPDVSVYLQAIPPNADTDQNFNGSDEVTLDETAVAINAAGDLAVLVLKNGEVTDTGWTLTTTTFTLDAPAAATDVWEIVTAYVDV